MNAEQIVLVQNSWLKIKPVATEAIELFYNNLFEMDSSLKTLLKNDIEDQSNKLIIMLDAAIKLLDDPEKLLPAVQNLAVRHLNATIEEHHYKTIGEALLKTLEAEIAAGFTISVKEAWFCVYQKLSQTMLLSATHATKNTILNSSGNALSNLNGIQEADSTMTQNNDLVIRLQGALDQSATPFIMTDRDFKVTYANQATFSLLQKHESVLQIKWPAFKADKDAILGSCIDVFHENYVHQRQLLDDPSNLPWKTDINIEHLTFELNVFAINDSSGQYIGNSLEWQDVTDARYQENKAVQLQGVIEQSNTPSMMIDRDFNITYANKATLVLLKEHEDVFSQKWPGFKADPNVIIGMNIDGFHKNPAHQRQLLADPSNLPWKADIHIEHLIFELNVTAISDAKGQYIGNALEWQNVTEIRARSIDIGRLNSAVEGMTTNLMMADLQGNIVYANPAATQMLSRRETQLKTALPSFSAAHMVGTNFDTFHVSPAHQQSLLGNPDNLPFTAEISVAGLSFQLTTIALRDDVGEFVGTAVQWVDLTEEKDAQSQIEKMINDAISGQLDSRIDTSAYSGFMKGLGDNINGLMDTIVAPISEAINVAQALSEGDLKQTMDGDYAGEFLALANAMNGSIANLNSMVDEIRTASTNVFDSAREIAEGNDELSHRTESQASSLEETASAMEELTSTVQQNAENATEASKLSSLVMNKANNGGEVVKNAITAMSDINKSSKKIADIISVIDEIAFQTNLLALNAAVEAARAGEQGRGFAVVAAEVRNLAGRSAGAAKEIKGLINDSVEAVGQGTKLVDETGKTFTELVSSIEDVSKMIRDIDNAGKEQSAGIGEVSAAVGQMDEMTQQNAALVEEAAASSKSMEEQSQALLDQVAFFNTNENNRPKPKRNKVVKLNAVKSSVRDRVKDNSSRSTTRNKPTARNIAKPLARQAAKPATKSSPRTITRPSTKSSAPSTLKSAPKARVNTSRVATVSDQEWEEF